MSVHELEPRGKRVQQSKREHGPLGPLWLITIGMGAFFVITAIVTALG